MAWSSVIPSNDSLLLNFPANCRANWEAIALNTDAALLITNAKVHTTAAIEESKILFSAAGHAHTGTTNGIKIALATAVSGILPVVNGGTGVSGDTYDADKLDGQHGSYYIEFRSGDMMISSLTTAPSGWTDVSATYDNKFIRISSGTPLTAGGADTVTLSVANLAPHTHTETYRDNSGGGTQQPAQTVASGTETQYTSDSTGSGTAFSIVPAYILTRLFKKD